MESIFNITLHEKFDMQCELIYLPGREEEYSFSSAKVYTRNYIGKFGWKKINFLEMKSKIWTDFAQWWCWISPRVKWNIYAFVIVYGKQTITIKMIKSESHILVKMSLETLSYWLKCKNCNSNIKVTNLFVYWFFKCRNGEIFTLLHYFFGSVRWNLPVLKKVLFCQTKLHILFT